MTAGPIRIAWHILLPMAYVSVLATLTVSFVLTSGEIGSTILLHAPGGETLPIALYAIEANSPRSYVAAMTLFQLLLSLLPIIVLMSLLGMWAGPRREEKGPRRTQARHGPPRRVGL